LLGGGSSVVVLGDGLVVVGVVAVVVAVVGVVVVVWVGAGPPGPRPAKSMRP
jgi:EamA domain-containing membrane protein RarD